MEARFNVFQSKIRFSEGDAIMSGGDALGGLFAGAAVLLWFLFVAFMMLLGLALTVFWILALVDVIRRQFSDPNMKIVWVLVILFAQGIGAIIYFVVGRKQGSLPGAPG